MVLLSFHNNKVFLTLDHCSLTLGNFLLTFEKLGSGVDDSWDSDPCENPKQFLLFLLSFHNNKVFLTLDRCSLTLGNFLLTLEKLDSGVDDSWDSYPCENPQQFLLFPKCFLHYLVIE